jgi:membrane protein
MRTLQQGLDWIDDELWQFDPEAPLPIRWLRSSAQLVALTARGFQSDQLLLRASALTYVTALSVIPMLGVVISILGLVGADGAIVDFAIKQLTTLAPDVRDTVRGYVNGLDFRSFGTIGGAILFGMAILALRHLEGTLNDIWAVKSSRSWARRFADYLAVMVVGPISVGVAVSLATTLQSEPVVTYLLENPAFAKIYGLGLTQVPLFFLFAGFTFLFWFFPNTHVELRAAATGGLVAAVLFAAARTIYVNFQVGVATYEAVFGALSAVPLTLAWLYVCWAALLLGAEVAFAMQNLPYARREMRAGTVSPAHRERIAVELAVEVARRFIEGREPPSSVGLADRLDEPIRLVRGLAADLEAAGILRHVQVGDDGTKGYVPSRPLADTTLGDVLRAVRSAGEAEATEDVPAGDAVVAAALERLEHAAREVGDRTTLERLAHGAGRWASGAEPVAGGGAAVASGEGA